MFCSLEGGRGRPASVQVGHWSRQCCCACVSGTVLYVPLCIRSKRSYLQTAICPLQSTSPQGFVWAWILPTDVGNVRTLLYVRPLGTCIFFIYHSFITSLPLSFLLFFFVCTTNCVLKSHHKPPITLSIILFLCLNNKFCPKIPSQTSHCTFHCSISLYEQQIASTVSQTGGEQRVQSLEWSWIGAW